jgi:3-hydroxyacyl-[acyl-carrier-protein] dehydratase
MLTQSFEVENILPHRYPFLLVDRLLEVVPGQRASGIKNVTINEPFFQGHFPGYPVMPGVLIVEAIAQVGAAAVMSLPENKNKLALFAGIDNLRFRQQVLPGDTLLLEMVVMKMRGPLGKGRGTASVGGKIVAEGEFMFALVDKGPADRKK